MKRETRIFDHVSNDPKKIVQLLKRMEKRIPKAELAFSSDQDTITITASTEHEIAIAAAIINDVSN